MIVTDFKEAFSEKWVREHIKDGVNELVTLRQAIPWRKIIGRLAPFYCEGRGRVGKSLRMVATLLAIGRLRQLGDEKVVEQVKENRYIQYFCNVTDEELSTFLNPCSLRERFMITAENFIGQPGDKNLYSSTLELYRERMRGYPDKAVTD